MFHHGGTREKGGGICDLIDAAGVEGVVRSNFGKTFIQLRSRGQEKGEGKARRYGEREVIKKKGSTLLRRREILRMVRAGE